MKRAVWVLVALAAIVVLALMFMAPSGKVRTEDPRTLGGPTAPG